MSHTAADNTFVALNIAVLTISDTRTLDNDTSGQTLVDRLQQAGHTLAAREIVIDDVYQMRAVASKWIADENIHVIISTGGTGFSGRDSTPEAMAPLFDKSIEGFGEYFRQVSAGQIGTSTIQSRALGGLANGTVIFCLPGSSGACRTGWDDVIGDQLDNRHRPCNFVSVLMAHRADK